MKAYLSLGTNMGDRGFYLSEGYRKLAEHPQIRVQQVSSIFETSPWGLTEQNDFWNIVIELETDLSAHELLNICQKVENSLGRHRVLRWGPRTIDIDILSYDNIKFEDKRLILPHPRMEEREFVLAPLREICPDYILPSGQRVAEVHGDGEVKRMRALKVLEG